QIGSPQEIYNKPANHFVASFIGESNSLEGTVKEVTNDTVIVDIGNGVLLEGLKENHSPHLTFKKDKKLLLSIRPEMINVGDGPNSIEGKIQLTEFSGVSIKYIVKTGDNELNVMAINT